VTLLTDTARRMASTLPAYYEGEPLLDRMLQARANEIDRLDAIVDQLAHDLIPVQATDALGLLGAWERHLELPAGDALSEAQRQDRVAAALQSLDAASGTSVMASISTLLDGAPFTIYRDQPAPLWDTLEFSYDPAGVSVDELEAFAERLWPAHRKLVMRFQQGWIVGVSRPGDAI
jgi:uncharacterized protein YmfQ (DUF2313 family)